MSIPVIAIFDLGKTNKKFFLFNRQYETVYEKSIVLEETIDENGEECEDLPVLTGWMLKMLKEILENKLFDIKAINFSTYGASFVYLDISGNTLTPLYNYLKKYPELLHKQFYQQYGGEKKISLETSSPVLGSLNSGLQLYRLKYEKPELFRKIKYALHLPQYTSYLFSGKPVSEMTSIGCHTSLWNFKEKGYHDWVKAENLADLFPHILPSDTTHTVKISNISIKVGIGLHDSSAALIPYLFHFPEPFILISTGTWCISLNPFNDQPLTEKELMNDCLCYMSFRQKAVKASRLFAGHEHEETVKKLAVHYKKKPDYFKEVIFRKDLINQVGNEFTNSQVKLGTHASSFQFQSLNNFASYEEAYHQFIAAVMVQQKASLELIMTESVQHIYVDGGFSKNSVYMNLLALAFPALNVYKASLPQSSARGAALAIHESWNNDVFPRHLIEVTQIKPKFDEEL